MPIEEQPTSSTPLAPPNTTYCDARLVQLGDNKLRDFDDIDLYSDRSWEDVKMWNDEDNNPYSSYDRRESATERPSTSDSAGSSPTNDPPEFVSRPRDLSDDEDYGQQQLGVSRKKGGYDSRIEQILYENPDLQIIITDAGKNHEGGGSFIVYTIKTGVGLVVVPLMIILTLTSFRILKSVDATRSSHRCELL